MSAPFSRRTLLGSLASLAAVVPFARTASAETPHSLSPLWTARDWINGAATPATVRGKVVLVDIFTFACYNCANVTPNLRSLNAKYSKDLQIVGVHSPETSYEKDRSNVVENLKRLGIVWPVAVDNDFAIWRAYDNEYWPTQLIFDRSGRLRKTIVGDSQDADVNAEVASLIAERT